MESPSAKTHRTLEPHTVRTIITLILIASALIIWYSISIFLIGFASILLAILLTTVSDRLSHWMHIPYRLGLALVLLSILSFLALFFWLSTPLITSQLAELFEQMPKAYSQFKTKLASSEHWKPLSELNFTDQFIFKNGNLFKHLTDIFSFTASTIIHFILFILVAIYLAVNPRRYYENFLALFPKAKRRRAQQVLFHLSISLRWWLAGKCVAMAAIGILTIIGLWLLKIPLAFILGLLIALFTFIPYVGAILASIPAILIAISIDPWKGLWVTLLYSGIHALEGYWLTPIIEQRTVSLPPALTILMQIVLAYLLGFLGLALASPLVVVGLVILQEFYLWRRSVQGGPS